MHYMQLKKKKKGKYKRKCWNGILLEENGIPAKENVDAVKLYTQ